MKKIILVISILFIFLIGLSYACPRVIGQSADGVNNLPTGLVKGETFETYVGNKIDFTNTILVKNNEELETYVEVTLPNKERSINKSVELSTMGLYKVSLYGYTSKNIFVKETYNIYAYNRPFLFNDSESYSYYGAHIHDSSISGQIVVLYEGTTATYGKIIDLSNFTASDSIFRFVSMASEVGNGDYSYIEFTFTDIYDSTNVLTITGNYHHKYKETYFKAAAKGQVLSGYYSTGGWVHVGNEYGTNSQCSLYNTPRYNVTLYQDGINLHIDMASKKVYEKNQFVIDLDDPKYFSNLWSGFTTGEVTLSVKAGNYTSDKPAMFMFTEIAKDTDLGKNIKDTDAPEITLNLGEYTKDSMPTAQVNKSYMVPDATAWDTYSGVIAVEKSVYINYGSSTSQMEVESDGKTFIPTKETRYTVCYKAVDYSGNEKLELLEINALKNIDPINITLNNDGNNEYCLGEVLTIKSFTVSGGTGKLTTKINVYDPNGNEVEINNNKVVLLVKGNYKVSYTTSDYVGNVYTKEYSVYVKNGGAPVVYDELVLPEFLISNDEYELPVLKAYDYSSGTKKEVTCKIKVTEGTKEKTLDSNIYKPTFTTDTEVKIQYYASNNEGITKSEIFNVRVVNVGSANSVTSSKYFYGTANSINDSNRNLIITANNSGDKTKYIIPLVAGTFNIDFVATSNGSNLKQLNIELVDSQNENEKLIIKLVSGRSTTSAYLNDTMYSISENLSSSEFKIVYKASENTVKIGSLTYPLNNFNGFSSGYTKLTINFEEIAGQTSIKVSNINGQLMNVKMDEIKPKVSVLGEYGGIREKDSIVKVFKAAVGDVFDQCITAYVSVVDPNNNLVTSVDGKLLDKVSVNNEYEIKLTEYGYYKVIYYLKDWNSNIEKNFSYQYVVEDRVAPKIEVNSETIKGNVNSAIELPTPTVSDNYTLESNLVVRVFVVDTKGYQTKVKANSNGKYIINPTEKGEYHVRYYVLDELGNSDVVDVTVIVR